MCDVNKTLIFKRIKTLSKMAKDISKNKEESMDYIPCCTELKALLQKLLEENMCSHTGDELINETLKKL